MSDNTVRDDQHRLLFEENWFTPLFRACKEHGLDWTRMCAIAYLLSGGDASARRIDWNYITDKMNPENPLAVAMYDDDGNPSEELIDLGSRWGLFQVLGRVARDTGYKGQLPGLASVGAGIKAGVELMVGAIRELSMYAEDLEEEATALGRDGKHAEAQPKFDESERILGNIPGCAEYRAFGVDTEEVDRLAKQLQEEVYKLANIQLVD